MNLYTEPSPEVPTRTVWMLVVAVVQGLACWCLPKDLLPAVFPPLVSVPVAFYLSERYLVSRPWLPSLLIALCWLPGLYYRYCVLSMADSGRAAFLINAVVYWVFCFFALPFIQTYAELGRHGLRAAELSARMNRNITLGLLGGLTLMPICLALGLGLGNIDWHAWRNAGAGEEWRAPVFLFVFSMVVPLTFAGAVNWAQISMEKQGGTGQEWPVLPFLRKTLGAISGWVTLAAGIAMACILLSFLVLEEGQPESRGTDFLRLMPAAFFWTACSMSVREGRWEARPRLFRAVLTACTFVFPFYMLWCAFMQWNAPEAYASFYRQQHAVWTWQNLSLGILLLASLGHGLAVCCRRWPAWASAVNVGVHVCILLLLVVTRVPVADPLRYEAQAKADWLVVQPQLEDWYYARLKERFGPYGLEALDRAFARQGLEPPLDAEQGKDRRDATWESLLARSREQAYERRLADIRATFAAISRLPKDAVVPESFLLWLAGSEAYYYKNWLKAREGQYFVLQDMNRDGKVEIILLDAVHGSGNVLEYNGAGGWRSVAQLDFDKLTLPLSITTARPVWDDLVIEGKRINLRTR